MGRYMTIREVAFRLRLSTQQVYNLIKSDIVVAEEILGYKVINKQEFGKLKKKYRLKRSLYES